MSEKITIATHVDLTDARKQLSELQKQIKDMREFSSKGPIAQAAQKYKSSGDEKRYKQVEEFRQRQEAQHRKALQQDLEKQNKELDKQLDREKRINQVLERRKDLKLDITKQDELQRAITAKIHAAITQKAALEKELAAPKNALAQKALAALDTLYPGGRGGSGGGGGGGLNAVGPALLKVMNLIGGGMMYGGKLAQSVLTQESRQAGARANIAGAVGELADLQQQRRSYEMDYYGPERLKALEVSRKAQIAEKFKDKMMLWGSTAVGATVGGIKGGLMGIPYGYPGIALGAIGGGIAGGSAAYGASMIASEQLRTMELDPEAYKQFIGAKGADAYKKAKEDYRAQNILKIKAQEYFEQNKNQMIKMQRAFGLSDEDLFVTEDSLYKRASRAGFNEAAIGSATMGMLQAGGTTKGSLEGGLYAAQMERGLNLTNAPSLMGRLSGMGNSPAESRDQIIRMYAEATRMGLNESEVRQLLETSTQMAYQTGTSAEGVQKILESGLAVQSLRGIEAAKGALEDINRETSEMGGIRGQLAFAEFGSEEMTERLRKASGNKNTKGFSFGEIAALGGTAYTNFSSQNKAIRGFLSERGIDPDSEQGQNLIAEMQKKSLKTTIKNDKTLQAIENLRQVQDMENKIDMSNPEMIKEHQKQKDIAFAAFQAALSVEKGTPGSDLFKDQSTANILARGLGDVSAPTKLGEEDLKEYKDKLGETGDRLYDKGMFKESTQAFAAEINNLSANMGKLRESFEQAAQAKEINMFLQEIGKLADAGRLSADTINTYFGILKKNQTKPIQEENERNINKLMPNYQQFGATNYVEEREE